MDDEEPRPPSRGPEWFLEKIAAGLQANGLQAATVPVPQRLSRAEINSLVTDVTETLCDDLARRKTAEPVEPKDVI